MITSKKRAALRKMANTIDTIGQVGKDGITDNVVDSMDMALAARQLVKFRTLDMSPVTSREAAVELANRTNADVVQVIGSRFVLYRPDPKEPLLK